MDGLPAGRSTTEWASRRSTVRRASSFHPRVDRLTTRPAGCRLLATPRQTHDVRQGLRKRAGAVVAAAARLTAPATASATDSRTLAATGAGRAAARFTTAGIRVLRHFALLEQVHLRQPSNR